MTKESRNKLLLIKLLGILYTIVALATVLDLIGILDLSFNFFILCIAVEVIVGMAISKSAGHVVQELLRTQWQPFLPLIHEYNKISWLGFLGLGFLHTIWAFKVEKEWKKYEEHLDPKEYETVKTRSKRLVRAS